MRILHINSYYYEGVFYKNLFEEQKKKGIDIDVYIPVSYDQKVSDFDHGTYSTVSKAYGKLDRLFYFSKHEKLVKDVQRHYTISDYDMIHAHSLFSNGYVAYKLWKKYNIPYIVAVRNTDVNVFFKYIIPLRRLGIRILKNAKRIVFISEPYKQLTINKYVPSNDRKTFDEKSRVISNGINDFWIKNVNYKGDYNRGSDKKISILSVGEINSNKNQLTTVKACEILISQGYTVQLDFVGRVIDENIYNQLLMFDFVKYHGVLDKEQLLDVYRNADVFVMPSRTETFGLVYAEAMSQGLPVLYSKGQGFDGQFEDGTVGFAVNCDSASDIAKKIRSVMNHYKPISNNATFNSKRYTWKTITNEYEKLYDLEH